MRRITALGLILAGLSIGCGSASRAPARPRVPGGSPPALAVLVSVDQLRADMPQRLLPRFPPGGFRRLYEQGVVYADASYAHSITETAVGHATLATGALPKDHGIVGNEWSERGTRIYAVDDPTQPLLLGSGGGKSPARLLAETIGDVLKERHQDALIRSVSEKERSAILMGGQKAVAYWLDNGVGSFVTSRFYASALPAWVEAFARTRPAERYRDEPWKLLAAPESYLATDDHPWERGGVLGRVFPHSLATAHGPAFTDGLRETPFADDLTLRFVRALLEREPLGRDEIPDLLAISFSSTDYVGHAFGPESREAEDNLLRLDRTLAALFALLDERVGLDRYFLILSADHGACESPDHFLAAGQDAGRVDLPGLKRAVDQGLRAKFRVGVELVRDFVNPSIVLDEQRIASLSLPLATLERTAAEIAVAQPGIHAAYTRTDLLAGSVEPGPFTPRIEASTHAERSGHVYVVPKEHWLLATNPDPLVAMHGTPWPYDSAVPIVVWGTRARPQIVPRPVDPRDIAPTIAQLLGLRAPRASSGTPLHEAL